MAKDMTGRFGIGGDTSVAGVNGVSLRFQVAKAFGIQAITSFSQVSATEESGNDDVDFTNRNINFAIRGDFQITGVSASKGPNMSLFAGVNIINSKIDSDDNNDDNDIEETIFPFEFGLKVEQFFGNHFSINLEVGVLLAFFDEKQQGLLNTGGIAIGEGNGQVLSIGGADSFGSAGFTFWFN
jgi:hypothetical protein